jgi:hypothetical protein
MRPKFNTTMKTSINESLIAVKVIDAHSENGKGEGGWIR